MGDIVTHRINIGLFYMKISMPCCKKSFRVLYFRLFDHFISLYCFMCLLLGGFISRFRSTYSNLVYYLLLGSILLLSGDIETNPGDTPDATDSSLSIFHSNIRSLRNKIAYITDIISDFDVVFFTETHLDCRVSDNDILLDGFDNPVRKDRNANGGGIIAYCKSDVNLKRRTDLEHEHIECMWFELKTKLHSLLLNITYRSERQAHGYFWQYYEQMLNIAHDENNNIICLGDLNKNFQNELPNHIKDIFIINGLVNVINKPTHFDSRTGSTSLIDPILITDSVPMIDCDTLPIDRNVSDHDGTYVSISCGYSTGKTYKRNVWDYKNGNYEAMKDEIRLTNWEHLIDSEPDINLSCSKFADRFLKIARSNIPTKQVTIRNDDKVWYDSELRRESRIRDRLRKAYFRTKTETAERKYKTQRNKVTSLKRRAKLRFYDNINENLDDLKTSNSKMYWKTVHMLLKEDRSKNELPPLLDPGNNNNFVYGSNEKADILNKYFCSIATVDDDNKELPNFDDRYTNVISEVTVTEQEVLDAIGTINVNKAVGPDTISNRMLVSVKLDISKPLCMLFNKSLQERTFPSDWKNAFVIPLFKKGDKSLPSNYRPVSLLSCVSKLFEKIIFKRVFNHLKDQSLLYKYQSGFIPGYSTNHQLIELYHNILLALDRKQMTSVTFADISKAFDTVWIKALLYKLRKYGVNGDLLSWFNSYLTGRTQRVIIKDAISPTRRVHAGVPQGSVLGPLLFLIFINDIADGMTGLGRLFADDTSIGHTAHDIDSLKTQVNIDLQYLNDWSTKWQIRFNPNKTDIMIFDIRGRDHDAIFTFGNTRINTVNSHMHLGVVFSSDCRWTKHIDKLIESASKQLNILRKLKYKLTRPYLEKIYLVFIRPVLEYASEVWDNCGFINCDRLEKVQLEAARIVTGLPAFASRESLYSETGWDSLKTRRNVRKLCLFYKIINGQAPNYLQDLVPPTVADRNPYNTRNRHNVSVQPTRLDCYQQSYFPASVKLWNSLDLNFRTIPTYSAFKSNLKNKFFNNRKIPDFFITGERYLNVLHSRLRNKCSSLNFDLYRCNLVPNATCNCGDNNETVDHYMLHCNNFTIHRNIMLTRIHELDIGDLVVNTDMLLYGSNMLPAHSNMRICILVQKYIKDSGRFTMH